MKGACGFSYLAEGAHSVCFEQRLATIAFKGCKNLVGVNRLLIRRSTRGEIRQVLGATGGGDWPPFFVAPNVAAALSPFIFSAVLLSAKPISLLRHPDLACTSPTAALYSKFFLNAHGSLPRLQSDQPIQLTTNEYSMPQQRELRVNKDENSPESPTLTVLYVHPLC